jgi:hypothetical protein
MVLTIIVTVQCQHDLAMILSHSAEEVVNKVSGSWSPEPGVLESCPWWLYCQFQPVAERDDMLISSDQIDVTDHMLGRRKNLHCN